MKHKIIGIPRGETGLWFAVAEPSSQDSLTWVRDPAKAHDFGSQSRAVAIVHNYLKRYPLGSMEQVGCMIGG